MRNQKSQTNLGSSPACRTLLALFVFVVILFSGTGTVFGLEWPAVDWQNNPDGDWPDLADFKASAWVVYDREREQPILAYHDEQPLYPASTTKIMTAVLALEHLKPDQELMASADAVALTSGSSKIGLKAGEVMKVRDLLAGLMLASGNDAANVLAEAIDGNLVDFTQRMNQKAKELGMEQTHFCNPSGLHEDAHVTSARDLAVLADYAMDNDQFRALVGRHTYILPATNMHSYLGWGLLVNSNRLNFYDEITLGSKHVKGYTGIKTGTTAYAGSCLVSSAMLVDGRELIAVVLGVPTNHSDYNAFSVTHGLIEEAARQTTRSKETGEMVTGNPTVVPTKPAMTIETTLEEKPSPAVSTAPLQPTATPIVIPEKSGTSGRSGLIAFVTQNPWRTAFIILAAALAVVSIQGWQRARRRKARRAARAAAIRPRRVDSTRR